MQIHKNLPYFDYPLSYTGLDEKISTLLYSEYETTTNSIRLNLKKNPSQLPTIDLLLTY